MLATATLVVGCGPEHTFSGAWKQVCDDTAGNQCFPDFVYMLHLGRYGDDLTGLAVRYVRADDPELSATEDSNNECGCYVVFNGSASSTKVRFSLDLGGTSRGGGPGCPDPAFAFESEICLPDLASPQHPALDFKLSGDEDALTGTIGAGDDILLQHVRFVPANDRTRRSCQAVCDNVPLRADGGVQ